MKPRLIVPHIRPLSDGAIVRLLRGDDLAAQEALASIRLGPNHVHAAVLHADGTFTDLGVSQNLLNTDGRDLVAAGLGAAGVNNGSNVATATSATSLTDSGESWTTDQFKGWTVVAEESTNTPVYGNVGSNNGTVLTIDAWKNADDSAGTTPGSTANYAIYPTCRPRYIGVTENTAAAAAGNTTLTSEITTGGLSRALGTYAHTNDTSTLTLTKSFSVTSTFPAVHRAGLFTASNTTAGGIMVFETVLNADANVITGDTLQITWTITLS
jgi:hypothetical protein